MDEYVRIINKTLGKPIERTRYRIGDIAKVKKWRPNEVLVHCPEDGEEYRHYKFNKDDVQILYGTKHITYKPYTEYIVINLKMLLSLKLAHNLITNYLEHFSATTFLTLDSENSYNDFMYWIFKSTNTIKLLDFFIGNKVLKEIVTEVKKEEYETIYIGDFIKNIKNNNVYYVTYNYRGAELINLSTVEPSFKYMSTGNNNNLLFTNSTIEKNIIGERKDYVVIPRDKILFQD